MSTMTLFHNPASPFVRKVRVLLIETVMGDIARHLGLDALDVRLANLYGIGERDTTPYGQTVADNVIQALVAELEADSDYHARRAAIATFNAASPVLKKGLALTPVKFGISFNLTHLNQAGALVHVYTDGSVLVNHGGTEMGQGVNTKVCQVVAHELGIDLARVRATATDTSKIANTSATAASTGADLNGQAAADAARRIRLRLAEFAAHKWGNGTAPADVRFAADHVHVGGRALGFAELVQQAYLGGALDPHAPPLRGSLPPADPLAPPQSTQVEMLGVGQLVAGYGAEPVLHGISLAVRRGEAVALLGANGAGKSTLMRALSGLHRPLAGGGIHLEGEDLSQASTEAIVARGMVLVPEGRQVFPELSVLDNIRLGAFLHPEGREARVEEMLQRFPRLRERLHQRAGLLSGGEQQMLAIARALMSRPRILLLDEPSLGLAPKVIEELFASLDRLRSEGMTLLLVDQMAGLALALADRAYVMESGHIVAQGSSAEIAADASLAKAYLGGH